MTIGTKADYEQMIARIETYLVKGATNLTESDLAELRRLSLLVEQYEDTHFPMPVKPA